MYEFRRTKINADGTTTTFEPALNADGYFVMADTAVVKQHNKRENNFYLKLPAAVAARLRGGGVRLRMRPVGGGAHNLITASEIEIVKTS